MAVKDKKEGENKIVADEAIVVHTSPEILEQLSNIVADAQVSGATVQIITIFPTVIGGEDAGDVITPFKCKPKGLCPK